MNNKLIITNTKERLLGFFFENGELFRIYDMQNTSQVGNVYCGYVKDIVKNINAAFVEFHDDKKGFLSLKGIPHKLKSGDKILVQVSADKIKTKDYVLTWKINIKGKYSILTVGNTQLSISKKISDIDFRTGLKEKLKQYLTDEYGFIIRTNAQNGTIEEITDDIMNLVTLYNDYCKKMLHIKAKSIIAKKDPLIEECNEFVSKYGGEIITDNPAVLEKLTAKNIPVILNSETKINLSNKYSLDKHLKNALAKHVWLKSGAYLIIEPTEAMTVIDVNTGRTDIHADRNKTFLKINLEAAKEIARQLQIRNISGTIVVDFINMKSPQDYDLLKKEINTYISNDYVQCTVVDFTGLGLLEMTRKKGQRTLREILSEV